MAVRAGANPTRGRIVRDPRIPDGEPVVAGTRVPVRAIVLTSRFEPTVAAIAEAYPMLDGSAIREALAYYEENRVQIDRDIAENGFDTEA